MKKLFLLTILCLFIYTCDSDTPVAPIHGCLDSQACNYNEDATIDNNSCIFEEEGYDCEGTCILNTDCSGECGGTATTDQCGTCDVDSSNDCVEDCEGTWGGTTVADCAGVCGGTTVVDSCGQCTDPSNSCDELILGYWWFTSFGIYENTGELIDFFNLTEDDDDPTGWEQSVIHFKNDGTYDQYLSGFLESLFSNPYNLTSNSFGNWDSESQYGYLTLTVQEEFENECINIYEIINLNEYSITIRENLSNHCGGCSEFTNDYFDNFCNNEYVIISLQKLVDFP